MFKRRNTFAPQKSKVTWDSKNYWIKLLKMKLTSITFIQFVEVLKINIIHLEYKNRLVNATTVSSDIHTRLRISLYRPRLDFLSVKPGGT